MSVPPINKQVTLAARSNRERDIAGWNDALAATWLVIDETNAIIGRLNKPVFDKGKEEPEVVFLMLFNSLSDIISAVYTLSSGWVRPCKTTLRGALETIATAVAVHHDKSMMKQFMNAKLDIPKTIKPAEKHVEGIARLYGVLTNQWTHETFDSTARSIHESLGKLLLIPQIESKSIVHYLNGLVEVSVLAQMVGIALETCFPKLTGVETHFVTDGGGKRSRTNTLSMDAIALITKLRNDAK